MNAEETDFKFNGAMIGNFVTWYGDFIAKKLQTPGIVFSPARKGFVSRTGIPFRAGMFASLVLLSCSEFYADFMEFQALCNLVGPYGVKLIDREILKFILSNVNTIKDYVSHNRQALDELRSSYANESW